MVTRLGVRSRGDFLFGASHFQERQGRFEGGLMKGGFTVIDSPALRLEVYRVMLEKEIPSMFTHVHPEYAKVDCLLHLPPLDPQDPGGMDL